jgi:hypothetical protein
METYSYQYETNFKPKRGAGISAFTGLLCFLLFCLVVLLIVIGVVRNVINSQTVETVLSDINVGELMQEFDVYDTLAESVDTEVLDAVGLHPDKIDDLLDETTLREDVSGILSGYLGALARGDGDHTITNSDITNIIENNAETIKRVTGHQITESDIRAIENQLNDSDILDQLSVGNIIENTQINTTQFNWLLSQKTLFVSAVLLVFALICLVLINLKFIPVLLGDIGKTLIVAGLLSVLLGFAFSIIISALSRGNSWLTLVEGFTGVIKASLVTYGMIITVISVVLIGIGKILNNSARNKKINRYSN